MVERQTVLICDDERLLREILRDFLTNAGFVVIEAVDGKDGYEKFKQFSHVIDVAILDIMMPYRDGFELCKMLRHDKADLSIIMLTAKNDEEDELHSFDVGADDFIPKPLRPSIVLARVEAVLKRKHAMLTETVHIIEYKGLRILPEKHEVYVEDKKINLSKKEYEILLFLWENRNQTLTREQILDAIWGYDSFVTDRAIDTHITRLRNKLGLNDAYIQTVRGYGYIFEVKND